MKAAIYCRVSTEEQAREGFSIAAQKKTLTAFCDIKDWDVTDVYVDEGISGKSIQRPAFQKMFIDAEKGLFQVILVWKINRFSRKNSDLLNCVEYLSKYNVNLVSYSEQFDASTPTGKLMLSMLGSIGEFERDSIVENIRAGMNERAGHGLFNGGCVLGYDMQNGKLVINEEEAVTVKRIFELYLSGSGYGSILKTLESEGRKTKNSRSFQTTSIRRILKNPIYAGYITYNKTQKSNNRVLKSREFIMSKGIHDPIVSKEDFDAVQQIISTKKQAYNRSNDYILSGTLKCPLCGGKMTGHKGSRKDNGTYYRYYICLNYKNNGPSLCKPNCINADKIESSILEFLYSLLRCPHIIEDIYKYVDRISNLKNQDGYNALDSLKKELAGRKRLLDKYIHLFENGSLNTEIFESRVAEVGSEINRLSGKIDDLSERLKQSGDKVSCSKIALLLDDFKNLFNKLSNSDKKRIINSFVREILLNPDRSIKSVVLNFSILPQCDTRYTDDNVKCDLHS